MKNKVYYSIIIYVFLLILSCTTVHAQIRYSGPGRNPPKNLSEQRLATMDRVLAALPQGEDPYQILGLILVESMLTTDAVSRTGDYGLMQVNCRVWRRWLRQNMNIRNCERELLTLETNIIAGVRILEVFRRHRNCRGDNVYACYNGGPRWRSRARRREAECGEDRSCVSRAWRPRRYQSSVLKHIRFLRVTYSDRIDRQFPRTQPQKK